LSDENKVLVNLGLSPTQSKIYLALLQTGQTTVRDIANISKIYREDVYKVLPSLQTLGLITKKYSSPTEYEAIQPKEAITILLNLRDKENTDYHARANEAINCLTKLKCVQCPKKEGEIELVSSRKNFKIVIDATKNAMHKIDFTTKYNLFIHSMNNLQLDEYIGEMNKAAQRGVKFRMILSNAETLTPICQLSYKVANSKALLGSSNFSYRYIKKPIEFTLIVFDDERCLIETSTEDASEVTPFLWTNSRALVDLCTSYFKNNWSIASEPMETAVNSKYLKRKSNHSASLQTTCI
jgi:hypothetical protein